MPKNIIRNLALKGNLNIALEALNELSEIVDPRYLAKSVFSLYARLSGLENQRRDGTISTEYYNMTLNSIRVAFFELLDEIPDMPDDQYELKALSHLNHSPAPGDAPAPEDPAGDVLRVLIFTANTAGETQLDLSDEYARIREMLDNEKLNDRCQLRRICLVTPEVIMEELLEFKPHIVHFSGHGVRQRNPAAGGGSTRGFGEESEAAGSGEEEGIELGNDGALVIHNGSNYGSFQIGADFLGGVFEYIKDEAVPTRAVVFNACHSEAVAGGVAPHIKHIVATNNEIGDRAAISFSSTFYQRLVANQAKPRSAFRAARIVTLAYGEPKDRFLFYENGLKVDL